MLNLTSKQKDAILNTIRANQSDIGNTDSLVKYVSDRVTVANDMLTQDFSQSFPDNVDSAQENLNKLWHVLEDYFASINMRGNSSIEMFIQKVVNQAQPVIEQHSTDNSLWDKMEQVPSLKNRKKQKGYGDDLYDLYHHDSSGHDLISPFPESRRDTKVKAKFDPLTSLVRIADIADDNGLHAHADVMTKFMPLVKMAQYEGFQQYCIQNSRAFEKSVRKKLETKSMNEAWWDTLEEYQKSLRGEHEGFLGKYASIEDQRTFGRLFLKTVGAKIESGEDVGVAIMESFDEMNNGKAFMVEASEIQESIDELEERGLTKEAGFWNSMGDFFKGRTTAADLAKRIQNLSQSINSFEPQDMGNGRLDATAIYKAYSPVISALVQFSQMLKQYAPGIPVKPLPDLRKMIDENNTISQQDYDSYVNTAFSIVQLAQDQNTIKDIDNARHQSGQLNFNGLQGGGNTPSNATPPAAGATPPAAATPPPAAGAAATPPSAAGTPAAGATPPASAGTPGSAATPPVAADTFTGQQIKDILTKFQGQPDALLLALQKLVNPTPAAATPPPAAGAAAPPPPAGPPSPPPPPPTPPGVGAPPPPPPAPAAGKSKATRK